MMTWLMLHPQMKPEMLGFIPGFLDENDPRPAAQQFNERYVGGWNPFPGIKLDENRELAYPGDPPMPLLAATTLRQERILFHECSWVTIIQPDGSYETSRMD